MNPWVVRIDFSNDDRWSGICALVSAPQGEGEEEFFAYVEFINNEKYKDLSPQDLVLSLPDNYSHMFCCG